MLDLTTSYGYYGSISFPVRPPSPFADGLIWSQISHQHPENDDTHGVTSYSSSSANYFPLDYNTNNNNNNNLNSQSHTWKHTLEKILKRKKPKKQSNIKHVHWIDNNNENIINLCENFVENLKLFIQNILNDQYDEILIKKCQFYLDKLNLLTNSIELKQAFDYTIELALKSEKNQLIQQQTFIAQLIARTILSC